jgi:hypothetical protein
MDEIQQVVNHPYFWLVCLFIGAGLIHPLLGFAALAMVVYWIGGIYGGLIGAMFLVVGTVPVLVGWFLRMHALHFIRR